MATRSQIRCWYCDGLAVANYSCPSCRVVNPQGPPVTKDAVQFASEGSVAQSVAANQEAATYERVISGPGGTAEANGTLANEALLSARTSNRAVTLLTICTVLGVIGSLVVFFLAVGSSSYSNPNKDAQAMSALVNTFVILVSYVITVPVFKYMAVRSREIAERKN